MMRDEQLETLVRLNTISPMLLTKWFHQLQNTGEHTGLAHDSNTFLNTRTLKGPPVMRWLFWNMSYHTAHHCFPGVPFHALPALHASQAGTIVVRAQYEILLR